MVGLRVLYAQSAGGESPFGLMIVWALIFAIFYFVLILPMKNKQRKLQETIKSLKAGDRVIVNPGIFGTIVAAEDDAFHVRIDEKTKIKVLKTAIAGLQGQPLELEKK